jgi:hypothetical protein
MGDKQERCRIVNPVLLMSESFHQELEKITFRNIIHFNRAALEKLRCGGNGGKLLSNTERWRLRRDGVILMSRVGPRTNTFLLTDRAERVLKEVLGEI